MELPELTCCILTFQRPWYGILTLDALINKVHYDGQKKFLIVDGGSPQEQLDAMEFRVRGQKYEMVIRDNLSDMVNACASRGGDVWLTTLDDFIPNRHFNITPDVCFLLDYPQVGAVRMGRLAYWGHPPGKSAVRGELFENGGLHWWAITKESTTDPYVHSINTTLYHRRFWDAYGDIPPCPSDLPGEAELLAADRYNRKEGPTTAIPQRFGEDCGEWDEVIWHMGMWRSDPYTKAGGGKRL